ncbi:hypothetical protein M0R89_15230 [Halorussus limi]|uniref:Uncharacterized protein n=2 Tax=Halorussus TaxID=1070314 RepID=A0A8U0IGU5_9EURY|nr:MULTISPECIES: hypothetical protein [Halorussus]UPV73883.1 hypothetical protein M0R89_15230 [Halorussus limi]UPV99900.1 hypothetical protein M0R88_15445 [Halorussus gelatinilyticus]
MEDVSQQHEDGGDPIIESFPDAVAAGTTVLVAGTIDPTEYALCLRALSHYSSGTDTALVVTTTEGASQTRGQYERVCPNADPPQLRLVDMASDQYITALYEDLPTISIPAPDDLERLVLALSELVETSGPTPGQRHLVIRSLSPILASNPVERVSTVLDRISGLRTPGGLGLFGLDYTAHDEDTMAELATCVDGILWVTEQPDTGIEFELRSTRAHLNRR